VAFLSLVYAGNEMTQLNDLWQAYTYAQTVGWGLLPGLSGKRLTGLENICHHK